MIIVPYNLQPHHISIMFEVKLLQSNGSLTNQKRGIGCPYRKIQHAFADVFRLIGTPLVLVHTNAARAHANWVLDVRSVRSALLCNHTTWIRNDSKRSKRVL